MWTEAEELQFFQRQGYRLTERRQAMFYFHFNYTKRLEPWPHNAETFYIVERTRNHAFTYTFLVNSEEEARAHKCLPTSDQFTIYKQCPENGRPVATFYNFQEIKTDGKGGLPVGWCYASGPDGFWQEERQYS